MTMSAQALFLKACATSDGEESDASLLAEFFAHRDERAFATLVRRHERTVWGVCKRVLPNAADAEDAFQATFLVLVCRGRTLAERGSIGGWLYRVAHRIAWRGRAMADKRKRRETKVAKSEAAPESERPSDLMAIIGEELERLSEPHRLAIIVCDLDGLSRLQAAARLGCNEGTLSARLNRGRKQLAERLRARGITTPVIGLGALMGIASNAPAYLGPTTVDVASTVAALGIFNRAVSASVAALVSGTTREMTMRITTKVLAALVLSTGLIGGGWVNWNPAPSSRVQGAPVPEVKAEPSIELTPAAIDLLRKRKVLKELKCAPEQRVQIEDHFDDWQEKSWAVRDAALEKQPNMTEEAKDKLMNEREEAGRVEVKKLLKPTQMVRLIQIELQARGVKAFTDATVVKLLKLTDDQKTIVRDAIEEAEQVPPQQKQVIQFQAAPGAPGAAGRVLQVFGAFNTESIPDPKQYAAALVKVMGGLTKDQLATWKKIIGDQIGFELSPVSSVSLPRAVVAQPLGLLPPPPRAVEVVPPK